MTPTKFCATFGPSCVGAMIANGGFASVRLAQIALESSWGDATPVDYRDGRPSYNLTGVKGVGPAGSVLAWTTEWDGETYVEELAEFRAYRSFDEHIAMRDTIFEWSNYDAYRSARTPEEACHALQNAPAPYATDPEYASKLIALIGYYDFRRFDDWPFADVPGDAWYANDISELKHAGVVNGSSDGKLNMSDEGIRILVMMNRLRKKIAGRG